MRLLLMTSFLLAGGVSLSATNLTVSFSGTFPAGTPTTSYCAPNATFSVSFNVASNPVPNSYSLGGLTQDTDVPITNFVYTLNNNVVNVAPVDVAFWAASFGGGINIGFEGVPATFSALGVGFIVKSAQMYTGLESAPTIVAGVYPETSLQIEVDNEPTSIPTGSLTIAAPAAPPTTPVPPSLVLALSGLALLAAYWMSRGGLKSAAD